MHHSQQESTRLSKHRYWTAQVELSAVTVKEEPGPAGPSCNTLEIYHKDPQDRKVSVMVEKAEYLLCPACGMACSSAAGLYAHVVACHCGLDVTIWHKADKKDKAEKTVGGQRVVPPVIGPQNWKLHVACRAQAPEEPKKRQRNWRQNFLFWVRACFLAYCATALQLCF